jgi:hypothetical protein
MEKNTKILLGLAAAGVVAYLVFKPKKAVAATPTNKKNTSDRYICPDGFKYGIKVVGGVVGITGGCKDANGNWSNEYPILNPDYVLPNDSAVVIDSSPFQHLIDHSEEQPLPEY